MQKRRVTITVDEHLLGAASSAAADGRVDSVSAWVAEAMAQRWERDRRLDELAALVAGYEAEHGVITDEEMAAQEQVDRDAAAASRAGGRGPRRTG